MRVGRLLGFPVVLAAAALILAGCGGGASSGFTLSLTPQSIKTFHFTWADTASETEYRLMENPDGSSGYTQVATIAANSTSYDLPVFLPGRVNASYILQACSSAGCTDSAPVSVTGSLAAAVGYAKASNTGFSDTFGVGVALSADGSTLAVGAPNEDSSASGVGGNEADDSRSNSGAVYVFSRSGSSWSQQAYVKASNPGFDDAFGSSVALSSDGNTLAVGAPNEDSSASGVGGNQADDSGSNSGAVYVFSRSAGTWSQQAYVKASNNGVDDAFGSRLALSSDGNTLAVSAPNEDSGAVGVNGDQASETASNSGAVYVFSRSAGSWGQQAYVKASNTGFDDHFGAGLALAADGNTLAVGAPSEDSSATGIGGNQADESGSNSGAVYVFSRSGTSWSQQAYVKASNTGFGDAFGSSVALSSDGNTLAVGAPNEDSSATGVGGNQADDSGSNSGAVYVFSRSGASWSQQAYVKASNPGFDDAFGSCVALSADGNTLATGAPNEDSGAVGVNGNQASETASNSGAVYVFSRSAGSWGQQAYVKASNTGFDDRFGAGLALAADGNTLAVGAPNEDSSATGIGGNQADESGSNSGAVYLY